MKSAIETSADLAAMRRPYAGNPIWRRLKSYQAINIVIVFILLLVVAIGWSLLYPEDLRFATEGNFAILSQQIPITAIAAIGVGMLMVSGEFDISVAGTFTLVPFVVGITFADWAWPLAFSLLAGLAVAMLIGLVNGLVTTRIGIPSFITTLGMMFVLRGAIRFVSINPKTNQPDSIAFFLGEPLESILTGYIVGPIYAQMVWLIVVAVVGSAFLNRHRYGNHLFASGGNRNAAIAVGVPVTRVKIIAFMACAVTAGFAGILQGARINEIEPSFATISGFELKTIAAVVVGGVSLFGGRGAILGMVLGAALLDVVDNLLVLLSAPETVFKGFLGAIIIIAVVLNTFIGKRSRS